MTHLDADVLAEFRAGLIGGRRGARIAGHLADCERCAELSGQLAEVSALLATVPAPVMPQSVAHRLDTVLAAEAARDIYPERAGAPPVRSPETRSRGFRLIALRVLVPAAAVLLAAAGYGLSRIGSGPTGQAASGSAAKPTVNSPVLGAEPGATIGVHQGMSPQRVPQSAFPFVTSSVDFQPATIRQQLAGQLKAAPESGTAKPAPAPLQACVREAAGGARPVLVENARFRGQPATIIVVLKGSGDEVLVAGPGCPAGDGHVVYRTTLPSGI
jgi:hypothetical protein